MIVWTNIKESQPAIPNGKIVCDRVLFVADGVAYLGEYHVNGCFYSRGESIAARTQIAEEQYSIYNLPEKIATHWCYFSAIELPGA